MISINSYLDNILSDFCKYLDANAELCELKKVHYDAGRLPDYSNLHVQQLYLLRYAYAYAFEYKCMYKHLLQSIDLEDTTNVLSIGCGNMIDYWALAQVISPDKHIIYEGFDSVDWSYKFEKRSGDRVTLNLGDAMDSIEDLHSFSSDIIVFPKSISEFSVSAIDRLCDCILGKDIDKDVFYLLISLRADQFSLERDMHKTKKIYDAILSKGFSTETRHSAIISLRFKDKKIRELDPTFYHPGDIVDVLKSLYTQCAKYKMNMESCESSCVDRLGRWPMLNCHDLQWQLFEFRRR